LRSSPAVSALTGTTIAAAARLMDREGVKRLPVVDDLGRLVGIVTRGDLLKVHLRPDDEILADVRDGILRTLLADESEKVEISVDTGVVTLSGKVDRWSTIDIVGRLVRQIPGVADVVDELTFAFDDRTIAPGIGFGVA
jgi:CBS-domain-containing membrane protein